MIKKNEKKILGVCPVCGKGKIMKYHGNYICTEHYTNADGHPRCSFSMPFNYRNGKIDDDVAMQLIDTGETDYIDMMTMKGNPYKAKIIAVPGKGIEIQPLKKELGVSCPRCGGRMLVTRQGYACENELKSEATCNVFVPNKIANRFIYENEAKDYLEGKGKILDGFQSNSKYPFSGFLHMDPEGHTSVVSKIGKCPNCGGDMLVGLRAFNCSNFKSGCTFNIFREYYGHSLTAKEVKELLEKGEVVINCTDTYGNIFSYRLTIDHESDNTVIKREKFLRNINYNQNTSENGSKKDKKCS